MDKVLGEKRKKWLTWWRGTICLYRKNIPSFLKKTLLCSKKTLKFFKNIKVFLQYAVWAAYFKVCTYASGYTYGGISLHIYMRKPTRTYASGHAYVCIVSGGGMLGRICHSKHFIHKLFGTILFFLFVYSRDFSNFAP